MNNRRYTTPHIASNKIFNKVYDFEKDHLRIKDSQTRYTTFSEFLTTSKINTFTLKPTWGISVLRDELITDNGATGELDSGALKLSTDSQANSSLRLSSIERGQYIPGAEGEAGVQLRIPELPIGEQYIEWGYTDLDNGFVYGVDSTGIYVARITEGVKNKIYQNDWNKDKLDGTGLSGLTLDLSIGNIYNIIFTWYGSGSIKYYVIITSPDTLEDELILVHVEKVERELSVRDPNQPISVILDNGATAETIEVHVGGRQFSIFSLGFERKTRNTAVIRENISLTSTEYVPLVSIKRKEYFPTSNVQNSVLSQYVSTEIQTDKNIVFFVSYVNNVTGGDFESIAGVDDSETSLLANISPTSGEVGRVIQRGFVSGAQGNKRAVAERSNIFPIGNEIPMTIWAKTKGADATVDVIMNFQEQW